MHYRNTGLLFLLPFLLFGISNGEWLSNSSDFFVSKPVDPIERIVVVSNIDVIKVWNETLIKPMIHNFTSNVTVKRNVPIAVPWTKPLFLIHHNSTSTNKSIEILAKNVSVITTNSSVVHKKRDMAWWPRSVINVSSIIDDLDNSTSSIVVSNKSRIAAAPVFFQHNFTSNVTLVKRDADLINKSLNWTSWIALNKSDEINLAKNVSIVSNSSIVHKRDSISNFMENSTKIFVATNRSDVNVVVFPLTPIVSFQQNLTFNATTVKRDVPFVVSWTKPLFLIKPSLNKSEEILLAKNESITLNSSDAVVIKREMVWSPRSVLENSTIKVVYVTSNITSAVKVSPPFTSSNETTTVKRDVPSWTKPSFNKSDQILAKNMSWWSRSQIQSELSSTIIDMNLDNSTKFVVATNRSIVDFVSSPSAAAPVVFQWKNKSDEILVKSVVNISNSSVVHKRSDDKAWWPRSVNISSKISDNLENSTKAFSSKDDDVSSVIKRTFLKNESISDEDKFQAPVQKPTAVLRQNSNHPHSHHHKHNHTGIRQHPHKQPADNSQHHKSSSSSTTSASHVQVTFHEKQKGHHLDLKKPIFAANKTSTHEKKVPRNEDI